MERKAAVEYLLNASNKYFTKDTKFSGIINDLARRVAMSVDEEEISLEKYCSRLAAELIFRDDYKNASRLLRLAEEAPIVNPPGLPDPEEKKEEEPQADPNTSETPPFQDFIKKNIPKNKNLPEPDPKKLGDFISDLGIDVKVSPSLQPFVPEQPKSQEDSEKTPDQTGVAPLDQNFQEQNL